MAVLFEAGPLKRWPNRAWPVARARSRFRCRAAAEVLRDPQGERSSRTGMRRSVNARGGGSSIPQVKDLIGPRSRHPAKSDASEEATGGVF